MEVRMDSLNEFWQNFEENEVNEENEENEEKNVKSTKSTNVQKMNFKFGRRSSL